MIHSLNFDHAMFEGEYASVHFATGLYYIVERSTL